MDGAVCHVQCEISSVEVTGLVVACGRGGGGALFLRCHVPAGGGRTIQIDSRRHVSADGEASLTWRDVASLACDGSPACVRELMAADAVVFEVRRRCRRRSGSILRLGRAAALESSSSELVGRAEVPWRDVVVSGAGEAEDAPPPPAVERRVYALAGTYGPDDGDASAPAPVLSVRMSVRVSETAAPRRESCGCERSAGGEDDVFGVVACGVADDVGE